MADRSQQNQFRDASTFEKITIIAMAVAAATLKLFVAGGLMTYRAARSSVRGEAYSW